jgi:hypothetical protein
MNPTPKAQQSILIMARTTIEAIGGFGSYEGIAL